MEHALLLACVMMGLKDDPEAKRKWEEKHKSEGIPFVRLRDRVFVAIGLQNPSEDVYIKKYWVMTFSDDLKDVVFWDPSTAQSFTLPDRVREDEYKKLAHF